LAKDPQIIKTDLDLAKKLRDWKAFYNFLRPHAALNGKTPYERLREKLVAWLFTALRNYYQHKWPWWDNIRSEPRFQAAMQSIQDQVAEQRRLIEEMNLQAHADQRNTP